MKIKVYSHTEAGKDVLNLLSHVVSTDGMEVYKCHHCDELFGSRPEDAKLDEKPTCGICSDNIKRENRDSHGLENCMEEDE